MQGHAQHLASRPVDHGIGGGAEEPRQAPAPMAAHDDEIHLLGFGVGEDGARRGTEQHLDIGVAEIERVHPVRQSL